MKILAIETSCDETAVAIVENGRKVLANVIASQIDLHAKTGGVVPEVAAREHVLKMLPVLEEALETSSCNWDDIDAIAATKGPGLISSLIIGTETANVISCVKNKPLIPVQHISGHIYSNWLDVEEEVQFPILILTVSGGHNELYLMRSHFDFEVLGETLDDAAGEAFDKVARILGLGYPGGPAISKIALEGDSKKFNFPKAWLEKGSLDFSFSGLKTSVLNLVKKDDFNTADVAASFQEAVVEVLSEKLLMAYKQYPEVKEVHLAGGVSANKRLREVITEKFGKFAPAVKFRHPKSMSYCTDNAAMIAAAAYFKWMKEKGGFSVSNIVPIASFDILC
ncbi:MAG: tRNA (adenosine(37)-N6)-threonylcarbamoyltransferase complex transferase subunit TsaD [Patescibacteria group bacterium]